MEKEPILVENLLRKELDEICENIHRILMMSHTYEPDKMRYNTLFREAKNLLGISKPTFQAHMRHLLSKKLVIREKVGKQEVYFYLNKDHAYIRIEKEMLEDVRKEGKQLLSLMQKKRFWNELPLILAEFDTVCNLKRWKLMLAPVRKGQKILGLATQFWYQQRIQEQFMVDLLVAMNQLPSESEKTKFRSRIMKALDDAIKIEQEALHEDSEKLAADIQEEKKE